MQNGLGWEELHLSQEAVTPIHPISLLISTKIINEGDINLLFFTIIYFIKSAFKPQGRVKHSV
jgi:hypothetical protein